MCSRGEKQKPDNNYQSAGIESCHSTKICIDISGNLKYIFTVLAGINL